LSLLDLLWARAWRLLRRFVRGDAGLLL